MNDISRAFCCSGTLGALVRDASGVLYVLSNNHVLARSDAAVAGEEITQPGRIDNACLVPPIVAHFTVAPRLESNVDGAIAALVPGTMDTTGFIEDIGTPSSVVAAPVVGLAVAKSGRTTGFTTGRIGAIANVNVQYQAGCGVGRKFVVSYTNQLVVISSTFSAGGDSGSLVVTDDTAHQPVGLLYAGSSTVTVANPAGEVLQKLSAALGQSVSFDITGKRRGGRSTQAPATTEEEIARATLVKEAYAPRLMSDPTVFGVGVGAHPTQQGAAAIVIYVARGRGRGDIPEQLDGVATVIVETDPIVAYGWNMRAEGEVCSPR